jgi:pre-mRNA-splicing factor ATP-dependent RNA helicase DHX15/PRP43
VVHAFLSVWGGRRLTDLCRLLENAPLYFDLRTFPDGETKRALLRVQNKKAAKASRGDEVRPAKKRKQL